MKKPILVVNDDPTLLRSLEELLRREDFYFLSCSTASEALAKAKGYDFSLALLDLDLGDMDAVAFYDALVAAESHYELPVVLPVDTLDKAELGALNDICSRATAIVISKPINEKRLLDLLERYGERRSS